MSANQIFNNYSLSNNKINNILIQIDKRIEAKCYIDGKLDEDLKQIISIKIFRALSKNRKK